MKPTGDGDDRELDRLLSRAMSGAAATPGACPQVELLSAWFDRALPEAEAAAVETHLASCARCQEVLGHLARTEPEVLYVHPRRDATPWTWHLRWAVPLAAAATIVFVVGTRQLIAPDSGPRLQPARTTAVGQTAQKADDELLAPQVIAPNATPRKEPEASFAKPSVASSDAKSRNQPAAVSPLEEARVEQRSAKETQRSMAAAPPPAAAVTLPSAPEPMRETIATGVQAVEGGAPRLQNVAPGVQKPTVVMQKAESARTDKAALDVRQGRTEIVAFVPGGTAGWRYARPGFVLRTLDGGTQWTEQALPGGAQLRALSAISPTVGWAAAAGGVVLRTTDGSTWQLIASPTTSDITSIAALDDHRATIRTSDGVTYDTGDGGATWRKR